MFREFIMGKSNQERLEDTVVGNKEKNVLVI